MPDGVLIACAGLKDMETAARWLDKAFAEHDLGLIMIGVEPLLDPLRSDARFQSAVKRMRFPDPQAGSVAQR